MSVKLLSVIILYHPQIDSVIQLIHDLHQQGSDIIIVDNSPNNHHQNLEKSLHALDQYHHFPENIGLGKGHNIAITHAIKESYDFLLIFDQDSNISEHFVAKLINTYQELAKTQKVAAVGPSYIDHRFQHQDLHQVKCHTPKHMIISSGALFAVKALKEIGPMDEELFIDFIDTEWCYRAKQKGYQVYQSASAFMTHELGNVHTIFGTWIQIRYSSPIRYYYFIRNLRRLGRQKRISKRTLIAGYVKHLPLMLLKCLFLKDTGKYLKNIYKGFTTQ